MNRTTITKNAKRLALGLAALALAATPSFAAELAAVEGTWLPPGGLVGVDEITMWGFVEVPNAAAFDCTTVDPTAAWSVLTIRTTVAAGLSVNLKNCLTEPVSFFVPGVPGTATGGVAGFFTTEAAASGGTVSYSFTPDSGTYLYQSATSRIRTQVPMGLYGALVVDTAANTAYPGVTYAQDALLVYSTIDPNINANPATYGGARVSNNALSVADEGFVYGWLPQYFLINGKAYDSAAGHVTSVGSGTATLLRFVNAGLETVVPTLGGGLYMSVVAEDGNLLPVAFSQYGIELQPGKTSDALISVLTTTALYDRALNLTNGAATGGGMLTYLVPPGPPGMKTDGQDATSSQLE